MNSNRFRAHFRRHGYGSPLVAAIGSTAIAAASAWSYCYYRCGLDSEPECGAEERGMATTATMTTTRCLAASGERATADRTDRPRLVFLGSGSSTGCPKPGCAMRFRPNNNNNNNDNNDNATAETRETEPTPPDSEACGTSFRALAGGDPKTNPDYRNNPCLLIHHYDESTRSYKNVVIDVGKTFRETALRWFPIHGIESLDAIVLTHHHMDAAAGLDDLRGFQQKRWLAPEDGEETVGGRKYVREPIPLYMSEFCHRNLRPQFPWLLPPEPSETANDAQRAGGRPVVKRDVASFDVTIFRDYRAETPGGIPIVPLPIWHGADLISHGFAFSLLPGPSSSKSASRPLNVVYLSDISEMVPETLDYIQTKLPPTDVLIVDALMWGKSHPVHYSLEQAVEMAGTIRPRVGTYLVGMNCDSFLPHDAMNAYLRKAHGTETSGSPIALARDGLVVELPDRDPR